MVWDIFTSVNSFFDTFSQQDQCFCILVSFQVSLAAVKCTTDIPFFSLFLGGKRLCSLPFIDQKILPCDTIHSEDGLDFSSHSQSS